MEIEIVKWFQSFSNSFLDVLNCGLTRFGEDIFFMCIFMMLYWCFSYGTAFKFALYYVISVACNALLKMFIKRPRPWMASGDVINKLPASGFSFPSGHSQSIASITTFLTYNIYKTKTKNGIKISAVVISILMCFIVGVSRLYLGQHYLTDVLTGLILGFVVMMALILIGNKFSDKLKKIKPEYVLITISLIMLGLITLTSCVDFGLSVTKLEKLYKYAGLACGGTIGFIICNNKVPNIVTTFNQRVIKLIIGYVIVFGLYLLLKLIPQTNLVVFLIMLVLSFIATAVYPMVYNAIYNKVKKES